MTLSLYVDSAGWMHRLHPAVRLLCAAVLFVAAFWADHPRWQVPLGLAVGALVWSTGAVASVRRLRPLFAVVFAMTFIVWAIFHPPDSSPRLLVVGPLSLTRAGALFALAMALKLTVMLAIGTLFLATTRIEEFAYALSCFGLPRKLGFAITLAFRMVPLFLDTAQRVVDAQRCRGLDFESGGLLRRARRFVPIFVPVFMGALRRTDGLAMALDGRGFQRAGRRTVFRAPRPRARDAAAVAILGLLLAGLLYLRWIDALRVG